MWIRRNSFAIDDIANDIWRLWFQFSSPPPPYKIIIQYICTIRSINHTEFSRRHQPLLSTHQISFFAQNKQRGGDDDDIDRLLISKKKNVCVQIEENECWFGYAWHRIERQLVIQSTWIHLGIGSVVLFSCLYRCHRNYLTKRPMWHQILSLPLITSERTRERSKKIVIITRTSTFECLKWFVWSSNGVWEHWKYWMCVLFFSSLLLLCCPPTYTDNIYSMMKMCRFCDAQFGFYSSVGTNFFSCELIKGKTRLPIKYVISWEVCLKIHTAKWVTSNGATENRGEASNISVADKTIAIWTQILFRCLISRPADRGDSSRAGTRLTNKEQHCQTKKPL